MLYLGLEYFRLISIDWRDAYTMWCLMCPFHMSSLCVPFICVALCVTITSLSFSLYTLKCVLQWEHKSLRSYTIYYIIQWLGNHYMNLIRQWTQTILGILFWFCSNWDRIISTTCILIISYYTTFYFDSKINVII